MRLAYVCADPGVPVFGSKGCSIHVQEFLRAALSAPVDVTLLAARVENPPPPSLSRVNVVHQPVASSREPRKREQEAYAANGAFMSTLGEHGPFDMVYERYSLWSFAGPMYARDSGIPSILEVNAPLIEEQALHRSLVDRPTAVSVARRSFELATSIVAVSSAVAEYLEGFPETHGKVSVHPNGVDPRRFRPDVVPTLPSNGAFTIGFVGSLKPWHGLETLVDAFIQTRNVTNARLLIVGDGPMRETVSSRLVEAGVDDYCTFTGRVSQDDIPGLLASMDVGVAPAFPDSSSGDYFSPLKVFEYMASGLPTVCSRSGQMKELVDDNQNGLLFTPGSADELSRLLIKLADDPDLRKRLGRSARSAILGRHSWERVVADILATVDVTQPTLE